MPLVTVTEFIDTQFDYIVVGGGTSGLTVAARLAENPDLVVGVIEAGEYHANVAEINIPGMAGRTIANPAYDWTFFSSPQVHAGNRVVIQPRGKGLGGSSTINFVGMFRPSEAECNAIEHLQNPGWNWSSLLTYMKKSENTNFGALSAQEAETYALQPEKVWHGVNGPVTKSLPQHLFETQPLVFDAAHKLGISKNAETGNGITVGAMTSFLSIDPATGQRVSAASAYFEPNANRMNLKVLTSTQVTRMVLEPDHNSGLKRVVALELHFDSSTIRIDSFRNVILSAGTFQTPQILELSGIGDETRLSGLGIDVAVNLPGVGENLQDHIFVPTIGQVDSNLETADVLLESEGLKRHEQLYKAKKGILATFPALSFLFVPAKGFGSEEEIQVWKQHAKSVVTHHLHPSVAEGIRKQHDIQSEWLADETQAQAEILNFTGHFPLPHPVPVKGNRYITLLAALMHPLSRGSVHISSTDPLLPPTIDPNYFGVETDLDMLISILKLALKLYKTQPLNNIIKGLVLPLSESVDIEDDSSLREYVKTMAGSVFHPVGTASMLPREWGGVVDADLRVYGTSNLHVVDASVLPIEFATHIQSVAYAIGEKASLSVSLQATFTDCTQAADIIKSGLKG